jgi:hypothetical protein
MAGNIEVVDFDGRPGILAGSAEIPDGVKHLA